MRFPVAAVSVAVLLGLAVPSAQTPARVEPGASASIAGAVVLDGKTDIVEGASVTLIDDLGAGPNRTITAGSSGLFRFDGLRPGRYSLTASKPGLVLGAYGADKPERIGRPIVLADGQRLDDLRLPIYSGAVVAGTVWSADNQPAPRMTVVAVRARHLAGGRAMTLQDGRATTDDRGRFRIFGLAPGDYAIAALPSLRVTAPVYFPGTNVFANATQVHLNQGDERRDTDIRLPARSSGSMHVQVRSEDGADLAGMQARVAVSAGAEPMGFGNGSLMNGADVVVADLAPGTYRVSATASRAPTAGTQGSGVQYAGETIVEVAGSGPAQEVVALVRRAPIVSGVITVRSLATPPRSLGSVRVSLTPTDESRGTPSSGPPNLTNGIFGIPVLPGRYQLDARGIVAGSALSLWTLRSIGRDGQPLPGFVIDVGAEDIGSLELTLVDDLAVLSGTLTTADGRPAPPHFIVLVAATADATGARRAYYGRPAADGSFRIGGVLDGAYTVTVVEDVHPDDLNNPAMLDRFKAASAMTLTFQRGEEKRQDLRFALYSMVRFASPHGAAGAGRRR